jgi:D-beta-D-heptose 7-phosphate kinase/D-beta-D-heptose 1-phosphate adenosyltransferase
MKKLVFINGVFDVLHPGHFRLFDYASTLGDVYVAIDADERVKMLKGADRPIHTEGQRLYQLSRIKGVHPCGIFETDRKLEQIIQILNPDIMLVGSDYRDKLVIGSQYAKELKFFERIPGFSSSKIIERSK